ncbi:YicC/YloC family endoribonuclease [Thiohalorhabdus sp.]|uniref:YicC/YloC family endoribonuclease n=1 Tax=Thiohalorhabdus sp. TaxID=3094134 RepID=UPI002FC31C85
MIRSMTAFARAEADLEAVQATWELRSVNHRYLEIQARLPEGYRQLEPTVRERVRAQLERGKVDVTLRLGDITRDSGGLELDQGLAASLVALADEANRKLGTAGGLTTADLMQWPGVVRTPVLEESEAERRLQEALDRALSDLVAAREREGAALARAMQERLEAVEAGLASIRRRLPEVRQALRERLQGRLAELQQQVDPERLEQELVLATQRMDVDEELDRLATHVGETRRVLDAGGACGRRLDFLMQEMNREANTIGSKSSDPEVSQTVVDLKVAIEQMREQAQNIE